MLSSAPPTFDLVGAMSATPEVALYHDYDQFMPMAASIHSTPSPSLANKRMAAGHHRRRQASDRREGIAAARHHWLPWLESECGLSDDAANA